MSYIHQIIWSGGFGGPSVVTCPLVCGCERTFGHSVDLTQDKYIFGHICVLSSSENFLAVDGGTEGGS